jgi:hypothetical protein
MITDEERFEDAGFGLRFRSLNEYMKIRYSDDDEDMPTK